MPSLILHAGFHKTGTSAIQRFAASHRRLLARQGLIYPRLWPASFRPVDGHHFIAHAVAGNERFLTRSQASRLVVRWRRSAERRGMSVLLSSEAICRLAFPGRAEPRRRQEAFLQQLRELLAGFDVIPVLVVRRQDDFVRSLYQEHVEQGLGRTARTDFRQFLGESASGKPRFLERLRLFRTVFGEVRLLVYERLKGNGLVSSFFSELGFELPGTLHRGVSVRASTGVGETVLKQRLNLWVNSKRQNDKLLRWIRSRSVRELIHRHFPPELALWPDAESRADFVGSFRDENDRVVEEFGGDHWGRLFPDEEVEFAQFRGLDCIDVDQAVECIVSRQRARLERILGVDAVAELVDRQ